MSGYNIRIEELCKKIGIGLPLYEPSPIQGGLLHRMYDVSTESGRFAIKALNPMIMKRSGTYNNYVESEKIARKLSQEIDISYANYYYGQSVQEVDEQYYLIYNFKEGHSLKLNEIAPEHSFKIGAVVAKIHNMDFSGLKIENDNTGEARIFGWDLFLSLARERSIEWYDLLNVKIKDLKILSNKMNNAYLELSSYEIICHGDLDPKNVLWHEDKPIIIDCESVGYSNPYHDFLDTALYWSSNGDSTIDYDRFSAFIDGYKSIRVIDYSDWGKTLYSGYSAKLGWLEYSIKRSLGIECNDSSDQKLGTEQVYASIKDINQYSKGIPEISTFLSEKLSS